MTKFSFLGTEYQTQRIIGQINPDNRNAIVVFVGAMHGNEPTGLLALQSVFEQLERDRVPVNGRLLGLAGNLQALALEQRFIHLDLNRIWTNENIERLTNGTSQEHRAEVAEQKALFDILAPILAAKCPVYVIDLHTTSAESVPFIALNDQLSNRRFGRKFPVPTVLGIEEYLVGPLLSYVNEFGHVALAFEAGRHDDPESLESHMSFVYLALVYSGLVKKSDIPDYEKHLARLTNQCKTEHGIYEVIFRQPVVPDDQFSMNPGFQNLEPIKKNDSLAKDRTGTLKAPYRGRIFMPLYQKVGEDGYFIVRRVPRWALSLSTVLRKINFEGLLTLLPGVSRSPDYPDALVVNKRIARFLAKELFHLLGYRRKKENGKTMIFSRREIAKV